jgi:hypothetical protein
MSINSANGQLKSLIIPIFTVAVFTGFSIFASTAFGLPINLPAIFFIGATTLLVYSTDSIIDHIKAGRKPLLPNILWLLTGILSTLYCIPLLSSFTWIVALLYLPLGLLWTVPFIPLRQPAGWNWLAPRNLTGKPILIALAALICVAGIPLAQISEVPVMPLGARAWLNTESYVALVLLFIFSGSLANALIMDEADFYETQTELKSHGILSIGHQKIRKLYFFTASVHLAAGLLIALGADNSLTGSVAVLTGCYTLFAALTAGPVREKWKRTIIAESQGLAIITGIILVKLPEKIPAFTRPFDGLPITKPDMWPDWMKLSVMTGAVLWLAAYAVMIKAGNRDKTWAMPVISLFINIGWEFKHGFITPEAFPLNLVNVAWFALDLGLLWQVLKYSSPELESRGISGSFAGPGIVTGLIIAYFWQASFDFEFANTSGEYSAFIPNALMSALFVLWVIQSRDTRGQRLSAALLKGFGSALYIAPAYLLTGSTLILIQGIIMVTLDLTYTVMLIYRIKQQKTAEVSTNYSVFKNQPATEIA